jgi:hypothetical protein
MPKSVVFFTALTYAQEKKFDPTWDKIDSKATKIAEFEGVSYTSRTRYTS